MRRLKNNFTGAPGERIPHHFLNTLANFWNDLAITGGGFVRREDGRFTNIIIPRSMSDDLLASFLIKDTAGTVCSMEPGSFFRNSVQIPIEDLPATIQCGTDVRTWVQFDTAQGTAQWKEGTAVPEYDGTVEFYPVHVIASDGTNIGTIHHEHPANFHSWSPSGHDLLASFRITTTVGTVALMEPGSFFRDSVQVSIVNLPATIQCGTDVRTWVEFDTNIGTAQWKEGTAVPEYDGTVEAYPVHVIASDGTNIGTIHHEHPANFHSWSPSGHDFLASFRITTTVGTVALMEPGSFFRDSVQVSIVNLPATIQCGTDVRTWVEFDTNIGTAEWKEGSTVPEYDGTVEVYPVHSIVSDGTTIGTVHHEHPANFHSWSPPQLVFIFRQTSGTGGDWIAGKGYIAGADTTITDQPSTISGVTTTKYYWILHDFDAATLQWKSGSSYTDSSDDTQEVYRMLEITCANGTISSFKCPHPCDIHATAKSS